MKNTISALTLLLSLLFLSASCFALSAGEQRTIDMLVRGGPNAQKDAAQNIYNSMERNTEVLDVVAEVLLHVYQRPGFIQVDATSWLCKALGGSGNGRYRGVLREVADKANERKVRKYASQSLDMLPRQSDAAPYRAGMVNLEKLQNGVGPTRGRDDAKAHPERRSPGTEDRTAFDRISHGMSLEEVQDLIGEPTATTSRITGKAWAPFYHGGDTARLFALYKGKGRIVFSNSSRYAPVWRVIDIVEDPSESGYP